MLPYQPAHGRHGHLLHQGQHEGFEEQGRPEKVFLRGDLIVEKGEYVGRPGQGTFIEREPYGYAYKGRMSR